MKYVDSRKLSGIITIDYNNIKITVCKELISNCEELNYYFFIYFILARS